MLNSEKKFNDCLRKKLVKKVGLNGYGKVNFDIKYIDLIRRISENKPKDIKTLREEYDCSPHWSVEFQISGGNEKQKLSEKNS